MNAGELTSELVDTAVWSDAMLALAGNVYVVPASEIRVLSNIAHPWQTYQYLTRISQIPEPERIRSDSSSRTDNIWGFPS